MAQTGMAHGLFGLVGEIDGAELARLQNGGTSSLSDIYSAIGGLFSPAWSFSQL